MGRADKGKAQIDLRFIEGIDLNVAQFSAFLAPCQILLKQLDLVKVLDCPSLEETFANHRLSILIDFYY